MEYLLKAFTNLRRGSDEHQEDAVTVEGVSICPDLRHDRLNSPSSWPGFKEFIAAVPPERGQPVYDDWSDQIDRCSGLRRDNIESFEDHYIKALFYAAFHFPETSAGGAKMETIYRWELIIAWESLRQVALTRICLLLMTQREPQHSDWVRPNATILTALWEWVSLARGEFERLDRYLYSLARYEIARVHISGWLEGKELPDRVQRHTQGKPSKDFPCEIFRRCKDIVRGKDVIPVTASTNMVFGIIRALVQQHQPFKLISVEPAAISWWRRRFEKGRAASARDDRLDLPCYPPESEPCLDVASVHAKEVDRWLLPLALRIDETGVSQLDEPGISGHDESGTGETKELEPSRPKEPEVSKSEETGIPQSDSAEKVDRQLCGLS